MNTEPYRIFWDDELWLVRQLQTADPVPANEDRRRTTSEKNDGQTSGDPSVAARATNGKSRNAGGLVSLPSAASEISEEKKAPAESFVQTDPETGTAYSPAGFETGANGYGRAAAVHTPAADPFPAIQKPADPTYRQNVPTNVPQNETSSDRQQNEAGYDRNLSRLPEESRREIHEMINDRLTELRVYVLESDITEAQQAVKSVVEQASF